MTLYCAEAFGWMIVLEAPTARQALSDAKGRAGSASLLPTDVTQVRLATDVDVAQYRAMGGSQ